MENIEKIIALFKYIKELCSLKYNVITDVNKQYWTCFLNDIPEDPENIIQYFRDRVEEEKNGDNLVLLEVKKPEFQKCPQPPESIIKWLMPGWDRFTNEAAYKDTIEEEVSATELANNIEHFRNDEVRIRTYEKWIADRARWVDRQQSINRTRRFFARLFQAYTDLERESETLEFMVGDGIIQDQNSQAINHPILLKRVKFDFDAKENIIRISDTDTEPEIYTLLLQDMSNINHGVVRQLKDELHEYFYHPLDRNDTPDFLKSLTHRLCSDSKFIKDEDDEIGRGDKIVTRISPVYFIRKRIDGTLKAIEEIISNIEATGHIPAHLIDIVGAGMIEVPDDDHDLTIDEELAALSGESREILLSKEANREQLEIAQRIEYYNAVLVQGPPGTGKTHTIANLLGHFLAQGKSVLVTSQTKKALSVLKSQVPSAIQNLCVSVLDDTNLDMVRSVDGISEYLSRYTSNELKRRMESARRQRAEIIERLAEVRKKIYRIKFREFEPIVYNGDSYSPAKAAEFVSRNAEELSYIPGSARLDHPLPVTIDELHVLYRSNAGITSDDEAELACNIPDPELLITPAEFSADLNSESEQQEILFHVGNKLASALRYDFNKDCLFSEADTIVPFAQSPSNKGIGELESYISSFKTIDGWMIHAAVDGYKGGGYRQKWEMLISSIESTACYAESIITLMLGKSVSVNGDVKISELKLQVLKLSGLFQKKSKISKVDFLFNKQLELTLTQVAINGKALASVSDCNLILRQIELIEKRLETASLWDELMAKHGSPAFDSLGEEPEEICLKRVPNIRRYLDWHQNEYARLLSLIKDAGFNSDLILNYSDLDSDLVRTEKSLIAVRDIIPLHIQAANAIIILKDIESRRQHTISVLSENKRKSSNVCLSICKAFSSKSVEKYEQEFSNLSQLFEKYTLQGQRREILSKIEPFAPEWARAIAQREGIHGETVCPDTIEDAWKWKQFAGIIDDITAEPFEELQNEAVVLSKNLREKTADLAANSAWYHLLLRTERNLDMKQALQGWKLTIKKIGKGTGKNAPALRKEARNLMAKCQTAVPAWIMPVSKALESLDPAKNSFDVIIVDEASQSDVSALAIMYMAKKVIIVGDDKQVSPMAIGMDLDRMNALREMYIKKEIPNWHLYDAKTSLYDIAGTTYQPLMLREHFRCVPDIIGYSNKLSYDFKIKPLRDASKCIVKPGVVQYRVDSAQREGRQKINIKEAEAVVSLMMACMEQKEYKSKTFGVISLLGDDQARYIQQLIFEKLEPFVIEGRRILCGNASHFQGDERDVMFLSMVDSNEGDGPLRMAGEGVDQSTKQRYNVAASRAKDQMWVVHSLDYSLDLKSGDIRRDLLEYAENPRAYTRLAEKVKAKSDSPFEEAVGKSLISAGYHISQQWEIGTYRIDIVVQYKESKFAVECDGELYHSGDDKVRKDMERQTILERMGWRFIRIRGSEYYRNSDVTITRVIKELNDNGIYPEKMVESSPERIDSELLSRVKIRAAQIIDEWHKNDSSPQGEAPQVIKTSRTDSTSRPVSQTIQEEKRGEKKKGNAYVQIDFGQMAQVDREQSAPQKEKIKEKTKKC